MKIVKNVSGSGRLPNEFIEVFNISNPYEVLGERNKSLINFVEGYDGHYVSDICEWIIEEVNE